MKIKACLTSKKQDWKTPKNIYKFYIEAGYLDPCPENPKFDGLKINWFDKNFVNPPYKEIDKWIDKALRERERREKRFYSLSLLEPIQNGSESFTKQIVKLGSYRDVYILTKVSLHHSRQCSLDWTKTLNLLVLN